MSLIAKAEAPDSQFEILDDGTHAAVCTWLVDIGPQVSEYQGETKIQYKVRLRFEVPAERVTWKDADGNEHEGPKVIWATLTNSLNEKAKLRGWLESWRGRAFTEEELGGFDLTNILGKPCMIVVAHRQAQNGKTYANITGIGKIMKGLDPKPEGEILAFDFDNHTQEQYQKLPEWLRRMVDDGKKNLADMKGKKEGPPDDGLEPANQYTDDDIPF